MKKLFRNLFIGLTILLVSAFAISLFQVLTAPILKNTDLDKLSLLFNPKDYPKNYHPGIFNKYSICSDIYCWSHYYFSPLFPHLFKPKLITSVNVFHLFKDIYKDIPYKGHTLRRDPIYNVYWIDDYGPFKVDLAQVNRETLTVKYSLRPFVQNVDDPRKISSVTWPTTISDDVFVIEPHQIINSKEKNPKIVAYREGNVIIIKDYYESGSEFSVLSGSVSFENIPSGEYDVIYIKNEYGIPNTQGTYSETKDIVGFTKYHKK
jgi:hypothetical protein